METTRRFDELSEQHRHRIFTFSCYFLGKREDAEDVTQEVLVRLWHNLDKVDGTKIPAWIARVTRNACVDLVRKRRRYQNVVVQDGFQDCLESAEAPEPGPRSQLERAELQDEVAVLLRELKEPYRSIIVLREIQGASYSAISETLELPLNTVKVYLHRGRRMLRDRVKERMHQGEHCA